MKNELKVTLISMLLGNIAAVTVLAILSNWILKIKPEFGPYMWILYTLSALILIVSDYLEIKKYTLADR